MFKECKITSVGKDVKKSELLHTEGGIWNGATAVETSLTASPKVTLESPYSPATPRLGRYAHNRLPKQMLIYMKWNFICPLKGMEG